MPRVLLREEVEGATGAVRIHQAVPPPRLRVVDVGRAARGHADGDGAGVAVVAAAALPAAAPAAAALLLAAAAPEPAATPLRQQVRLQATLCQGYRGRPHAVAGEEPKKKN